ncbi:MAG: ABC transporter permease, partial [Candidatus Nephrothrix sp. EaCA]
LEFRRKSVAAGLGLYLSSTVFIGYLSLGFNDRQQPGVWAALFWITLLFAAISTIAKSFIGEKPAVNIYYYSLVDARTFLFSKIIYNALLTSVISVVGYGLFALLLANLVRDVFLFFILLLLMSVGFSAALTLISALAAKSRQSHLLMAVLGFPVIIGMLSLAIKVTTNCIFDLERSSSSDELLAIAAINLLLGSASYLLFPYIWRS